MTRCNWYDGNQSLLCTWEGQHVLIYGCLNQHIGEIVFCRDHLIQWDEMAVDHKAWCPKDNCSETVADWEVIPLNTVTIGWLRRYAPQ